MKYASFYEINFPADIAYGANGGPEFFTDIVTSSSGFEERNINWLNSRCRYNLAPSIKTQKQLDDLIAFFRIANGRAIGFRFKDWSDYQINQQQVAVADGINSSFQITKHYKCGEHQITRKIVKLVNNKVKIYCDEVLVFPYIDINLGQIKFDNPPNDGVKIFVDAEFDVPVRFDIDRLVTSIESYGVYSHQEIPLIELKL